MSISNAGKVPPPIWEGCSGEHFQNYVDALLDWSITMGAAGILFSAETGVHESDTQKTATQNALMMMALKAGSAVNWIALRATYTADVEAADADGDTPAIIGRKKGDLKFDAAACWDNFKKHASGSTDATAGPALMRTLHNWEYPVGGTYVSDLTTAIQQLTELQLRSDTLANPEFRLSATQLSFQFKESLPSEFDHFKRAYRKLNTLPELLIECSIDAGELDASRSSRALLLARRPKRTSGALGAPKALIGASGGYKGSADTARVPKERQMDQSAGPPNANMGTWCPNHGWCKHSQAACKSASTSTTMPRQRCWICTGDHAGRDCPRPSQEDAENLSKIALIATYGDKADGDSDALYKQDQFGKFYRCALTTSPTWNHDKAIALIASGQTNQLFIDSGGDHSIETNIDNLHDLVMFPAGQGRSLSGVGGAPLPILGQGLRTTTMVNADGKTTRYTTSCLYVPEAGYRLEATNGLAESNISTLVDSSTNNNQLSLLHQGTSTHAIRHGNLWCVPVTHHNHSSTDTAKAFLSAPTQPVRGSTTTAPASNAGPQQGSPASEGLTRSSQRWPTPELYGRSDWSDIEVEKGFTRANDVMLGRNKRERVRYPDVTLQSTTEFPRIKPNPQLLFDPVIPTQDRASQQLNNIVSDVAADTVLVAEEATKVTQATGIKVDSDDAAPPDPPDFDGMGGPKDALKSPPTPQPAAPTTWMRAVLGGIAKRSVATFAKRLGVKLRNSASTALDQVYKVANKRSGARTQDPIPQPPRTPGSTIVSDTLGGQQYGHFYQLWMDPSSQPAMPYITVNANHSAGASVQGIKEFARQTNTVLDANQTIMVDGGTEYKGDFLKFCTEHDMPILQSSAYMHNTNHSGTWENMNQQIQARVRNNLQLSTGNFLTMFQQQPGTKGSLTGFDFLSFAYQHAALQIRTQHELEALDNDDTISAAAKLAALQRKLPVPWGCFGTLTNQAGQTSLRGLEVKQLQPRGTTVIFLGTEDRTGRYIVLTTSNKVVRSADVSFDVSTCCNPVPEGALNMLHKVWIDFDMAEGAAPPLDTGPPIADAPHVTFAPDDDVEARHHDHGTDTDLVDTDEEDADITTEYRLHEPVVATFNTLRKGQPLQPIDFGGHIVGVGSDATHDLGSLYVACPRSTQVNGQHGDDTVVHYSMEELDLIRTPTSADNYVAADPLITTDAYAATISEFQAEAAARAPTIAQDAAALAARTSWVPHPSVAAYINQHGQILHEVIRGAQALPPPPPLPEYLQHDCPTPPTSLKEALAGPDAIHWLHATMKEIQGQQDRPTFECKHKSELGKTINFKLVFTFKFENSKLVKYKARMCLAAWNLQRGEHYSESYTGTPPASDLKDIEIIALEMGWFTAEMDAVQAYLNSLMPPQCNGAPVTARFPDGLRMFSDHPTDICFTNAVDTQILSLATAELAALVHAAIYGHPSSGYAWSKDLTAAITSTHADKPPCPLTILQSITQPSIYYATFPDDSELVHPSFIVWVNNDNIRTYCSHWELHVLFATWIRTCFEMTGGEQPLQTMPTSTVLGMEFTYAAATATTPASLRIDMEAYGKQLLADNGMLDCNPTLTPLPPGFNLSKFPRPDTPSAKRAVVAAVAKMFPRRAPANYDEACTLYRSIAMGINWFATMVAPGMKAATSIIGRAMINPPIEAFQAVKQMLRFIRQEMTLGLTYYKSDKFEGNVFPQLSYYSDASFGDDHQSGKTQGGFCANFDGQAVSTFVSRQSSVVCVSTFHAETHFCSQAAKDIMYKRALFKELGFHLTGPTPLYVDNAAVILDAGSDIRKFSQQSKHFTIAERLVHQCVDDGSIVLIKANGKFHKADALTKPLPREPFQRYNNELHAMR
jgi:hypothetical protein